MGSLSREWLDRVKDIRSMAKDERQRPDTNRSLESAVLDGVHETQILPDNELFAEAVSAEPSPRQVFSSYGDKGLFKSPDVPNPVSNPKPSVRPPVVIAPNHSHLIQKVIAASLALIVMVLIYAVIKFPSLRFAGPTSEPVARKEQPEETSLSMQMQEQEAAALIDDAQPVSLGIADNYYLSDDYEQAAVVYTKLIGKMATSTSKEDNILRDFLRLRLILCLKETTGEEELMKRLKIVSTSSSPVVRIIAKYHMSMLEMVRRQYLTARSRAYQTLALLDTVDDGQSWMQEMRRNCHFLIAASLSNEVLSISDADKDLPPKLWTVPDFEEQPFAGMDEDQLRAILTAGTKILERGTLGPRIQPDTSSSIREWMITSNGISVDELMNRFAANAGYDIRWMPTADRAGIRERAVQMHLSGVADEHAASMIAGCAGLLTELDESGVINIYNPAEYDTVSEQLTLLGSEAISLWRKFLLAFDENQYLANAHFALGLLCAQHTQVVESIAEYKIVFNRFPRSPLSPWALFNSSQLKADLRDYSSAHKDLKELVEQYPDCSLISQAYFSLAEMTAKTGFENEAAKLYCKIYYLNASTQFRAAAALAAAEIFYKTQAYDAAYDWLIQYIDLKKDEPDKDLGHAYYLLGKVHLRSGKTDAACAALQKAVAGYLPRQEYVDAISTLVEACIQREKFIAALDVLEDAYLSQFSQEESVKLMILKSRVLRAMGLVDKSLALLGDRQDYIVEPVLKTKMICELSECYIQQGNLESAFKKLSQNYEESEPGPLAQQTGIRLAEVCLMLERDSQAMSICSQLLERDLSDDIRYKALEILAAVYERQNNYENAALVLMGQIK